MGTLDFEFDTKIKKHIQQKLKRRNLKIDDSEEWEVHGPHPDMNYKMYVGYAYKEADPKAKCICPSKKSQLTYCSAHKRYYCVAIYPWAVYEVEEPSKWYEANPGNRIPIPEKLK